MQIETYIRAAGTNGMLVDAANMPAAVTPPTTCLGMSADIRIHFFNGDVAAQMTAEDFDAITTWRLSVDSDYNQSTEPLLRYTNGIDVDDDGTVCVLIPNVSSQKLIEALGTRSSGEYIAELVGYVAGETVPVFVVQFPFVVSNRIDLEGGDETEPVEGNYYTNAQINALLSAPYEVQFSVDGESWHSEQTYLDEYFRIRNSAVQGAEWSEPMRLLAGVVAQEQADWNETDTTSKAYINNKPVVADAATNAQIDSRSASKDIRPSNVEYAVRSVMPNVTTIPAATTAYTLLDASATTNSHSAHYTHAPTGIPTYTLPAVTNTTIAHEILLDVDFTTVQACGFVDSQSAEIPLQSDISIAAGDKWRFICVYSLDGWRVYPLPIEVAGGGGGGASTLIVQGTTATSAGLAGTYEITNDTVNDHPVWFNSANSKYLWLVENGMDAGWFGWVIGSTVAQQSAGDIPMFYEYFVADKVSPSDTPVGETWRTQTDELTAAQFTCVEG